MAITENHLQVMREALESELTDANGVRAAMSGDDLATFIGLVGAEERYRLAVTADFFAAFGATSAIVAELETRFVARELRDHPSIWLILDRDGPPGLMDPFAS
jgi:hypothetical protein